MKPLTYKRPLFYFGLVALLLWVAIASVLAVESYRAGSNVYVLGTIIALVLFVITAWWLLAGLVRALVVDDAGVHVSIGFTCRCYSILDVTQIEIDTRNESFVEIFFRGRLKPIALSAACFSESGLVLHRALFDRFPVGVVHLKQRGRPSHTKPTPATDKRVDDFFAQASYDELLETNARLWAHRKPLPEFAMYVPPPAVVWLAEKLGGKPNTRLTCNDPYEFDVVSTEYLAQTRRADVRLSHGFMRQVVLTFKSAEKSGKMPYFHFSGRPDSSVVEFLLNCENELGISYVLDVQPVPVEYED